jgi:hypothetical protein
MQHYVINFVSDLRQLSGFLWVLRFPPPIKPHHHDITEKLLKVALNTINQAKPKVQSCIKLNRKPTKVDCNITYWSEPAS